jgi:hypothetical protein
VYRWIRDLWPPIDCAHESVSGILRRSDQGDGSHLDCLTHPPSIEKDLYYPSPKGELRADGVAQVVEDLSNKYEALSSNPSAEKKKKIIKGEL